MEDEGEDQKSSDSDVSFGSMNQEDINYLQRINSEIVKVQPLLLKEENGDHIIGQLRNGIKQERSQNQTEKNEGYRPLYEKIFPKREDAEGAIYWESDKLNLNQPIHSEE